MTVEHDRSAPRRSGLHRFFLGLAIVAAVLVMAILAFCIRLRHGWPLVALCVGQYVLVHVQLRLGLGSNDDPGLLAFHVPVGVLILVVSYAMVWLAWPTWRQRPCQR